MRILYVEDNQANVYLVRRVALGHEVINYIDGEQTLENIESLKPDLILMDIQLAGPLSGLDVVRKIREKGIETPIVAVTAYAMVGDREKCLAAGCDDYMAKPLPIAQLVGIIKQYDQQALPTTDTAPDEETPSQIDDAPESDIENESLIIDVDEDTAKTD